MKKPYVLIAVVNGHDLPARYFDSENKAYRALVRALDTYNLQVVDQYQSYNDQVYHMEGDRTWFRIRSLA